MIECVDQEEGGCNSTQPAEAGGCSDNAGKRG